VNDDPRDIIYNSAMKPLQIIVVAITILNTVLMSVLERQKEYGVLRAIGTRPGRIVGMVVTETALLAAASIVLGSILGFLLNLYFSRHGIALANPIEWGSMQFRTMKGEINARSFYLPTCTVIVTSLRTEGDNGYAETALRMRELAREQPGYLGFETARDGLGISVSYWESPEAIRAW